MIYRIIDLIFAFLMILAPFSLFLIGLMVTIFVVTDVIVIIPFWAAVLVAGCLGMLLFLLAIAMLLTGSLSLTIFKDTINEMKRRRSNG